MQRSESIAALAKAFAAARPKVGVVVKDKKADIAGRTKEGKEYKIKYNYADLSAVIDAYTDSLAEHGLVLLQPVGGRNGHLVVTTLLLHESGEWISEEYPVAIFAKPQDQGTAISYARRYAVQSFLGLASEDDDGKSASTDNAPHVNDQRAAAKAEAKPADTLNNDQRHQLVDVAKSAGLIEGANIKGLLDLCTRVLGRPIDKSSDIKGSEFAAVMGAVEAEAGKAADIEEMMGDREPGVEG